MSYGSMQRANLPTFDLRPKEVKPGDFKEALWEQYRNCYNALNTLETESRMKQGSSFMESHVSIEKFVVNVDILESSMYAKRLLEALGECCNSFADARKKFADLQRILIEKVWIERTEDLGHI